MYDYNATRKPIILNEYGRNVQKLVESIKAIKDKAERTAHAQSILKLMALLDVNSKHSTENVQKHWDALFIISDYTLDVDSPYPMPEKAVLNERTQRPTYTQRPIKFKNYGRNVERLIQKAINTEDRETQEKMVIDIVRLMKNFSNEWNNDNVDISTLVTNLKHMAGNQLMIDIEKLKAQNIFPKVYREKNRSMKTNRRVSGRRQKNS